MNPTKSELILLRRKKQETVLSVSGQEESDKFACLESMLTRGVSLIPMPHRLQPWSSPKLLDLKKDCGQNRERLELELERGGEEIWSYSDSLYMDGQTDRWTLLVPKVAIATENHC